jgi:hypothetical protein
MEQASNGSRNAGYLDIHSLDQSPKVGNEAKEFKIQANIKHLTQNLKTFDGYIPRSVKKSINKKKERILSITNKMCRNG